MTAPRPLAFPLARPLVIAHRGHSARAPENTMAAFEAARLAGADMIELDVTLSADGRLVVIHDADLDRTTNGTGPVSARTLARLRTLDAGSWFGAAFAGQRLPTLEEVLEAYGPHLLINVEIKPEAARVRVPIRAPIPVAAQVAGLVRGMGLVDTVLVSSFDFQVLLDLRARDPDIRIGVLSEGAMPGVDLLALVRAVGAVSWHPDMAGLDQERVAAMHGQACLVLVWAQAGQNTPETMRQALEMGADGFFANDPEALSMVAKQVRVAARPGQGLES